VENRTTPGKPAVKRGEGRGKSEERGEKREEGREKSEG
jgi:hypothetical protein